MKYQTRRTPQEKAQQDAVNDYYNKKNDERFLHFRASMIGIAILLMVSAVLSFGYMNYTIIRKPVQKIDKCTGYTVLDAHRVILCDGDTVFFDWHLKLRRLAK